MSEVPKLYTGYQICTQVPKSSLRQMISRQNPSASGSDFGPPVFELFMQVSVRNGSKKWPSLGRGSNKHDLGTMVAETIDDFWGSPKARLSRKWPQKTGQNNMKSVKKCLFFFRIVINFYQPQNFERFWSGISKICTRNEKTGSEFGISWGSPFEGLKTPENV